jgi:hypothetical protein
MDDPVAISLDVRQMAIRRERFEDALHREYIGVEDSRIARKIIA